MHALDRLEAEDQADFAQVLRLALESQEIRTALRHADAGVDAEHLRSQAVAATEAISAAAAAEHTAYLRLRATAGRSAARRFGHPRKVDASTGGRELLTALAVLTPVLSATASAICLLLGYSLRLAGTQQHLAAGLVGTGWIVAALAGLAALAAAAALIATAMRHLPAPGGNPRHADTPSAMAAREAWRQALLERGTLPFLHQQLRLPATASCAAAQPPPPRPTVNDPLPERRTRLGYTSPDFASPDFTDPVTPSRD
ncbi:hypothetical protein [Streptomyces sp. NPDC057428]|uniref:hypothetical protein n=1 Tax=Streptomyces sp. NPDC057428 TaxID=3346129 RepID=UPI0036BE21FD